MTHLLIARISSFTLLASALLFVAGPVQAQNMMGYGSMYSRDGSCHHSMMIQSGKHLSKLKSRLHLTKEQMPAWDEFLKSMNTPPVWSDADRGKDTWAKLTTPERVEKMNAMHDKNITTMQAHMKQHSEAILKFYNQLTTDQQKIFDVQATRMHSKGMQ
jgi:protein CpxP